MKRKTALAIFRRDPNMERAKALGMTARLVDKPLTACPNFLPTFGEIYGTQLCAAWMDGWHTADRKLRQPRMEMKGAD